MPRVEVGAAPGLTWLVGVETGSSLETYLRVVRARQQFKVRVSELGARVKVTAELKPMRGSARGAEVHGETSGGSRGCVSSGPGFRVPGAGRGG